MAPSRSRLSHGFSILEALIALTVLLIGLVGMLQFLIHGARSDRAARAQTLAAKAAEELLTGLQGLAQDDPRLVPNATGETEPATFGRLLAPDGTIASSGTYSWSDSTPIPGVRTDAELALGPERSLNLQRQWVVWDYVPPSVPTGMIRMISVSVIYTDVYPQEVVVYGQRTNLGALLLQGIFAG